MGRQSPWNTAAGRRNLGKAGGQAGSGYSGHGGLMFFVFRGVEVVQI